MVSLLDRFVWKTVNAAARVACPHRLTSLFGVNQRSSKVSPVWTKNAVSERLFSAAMAWSVASGRQESRGQTAAGLP